MIYKCEECECQFEIDILSANERVAFAVCAKCGNRALADNGATEGVRDLENNFKSF